MKATFTRAWQGRFGVTLVAMGCAMWGGRAMAAPGDLDPSFKPELLPGENVVSIAVDASGMIYAQLEVPRGAPAEAPLVVRLHPDGRRDPTFVLPCGGPVEECWREDLVIAPDGSLYVPAKFGGEQGKPSLRRYTTNGTHDPEFNPQLSLNRCPTAILPTRDGRVWVAGTLADGRERFLGSLEADGRVTTLRRPPTTGGGFEFMELVERPDGRVVAAGQFQWGGEHPRMSTAQFHPDLELDTTFSPPFPASNHLPFPTIWTATFQSDGRLLVGGLFLRLGEHRTSGIGRLQEDGAPDRSFSTPPMDDDVERIHVDAEGRILVVGDFRRIGGWIRPQLARLLPDGSVDGGFMPPTIQDRIQSTRMASDGGLLVVAGANSKDRLFKLQGGECPHSPPEIAIQPKPSTGRVGGRLSLEVGVRSADSCQIQWFHNGTAIPTGTNVVLVLGKLTSIDNGTYAVRIENRRGSVSSRAVSVVVEPTEAKPGWPDLRFGLGSGPDHTVEVLRSLPGGRILVAGGFRGLGTFTNTGPIVVLREDGSLDPMFRLRSISGRVDGLEILEDGRLLAWGFLNQPNPRRRRGVMVLHPNGEVDSSFGDSLHPSTEVRKVVRLRDGRFLVSGYLIPPAGDQVMSTLRLNPNGSLDTTFQPAENPGRMETFAALTSGRLAVVWKPRDGHQASLGRLLPDGMPDPSFQAIPFRLGSRAAIMTGPDDSWILAGQLTSLRGQSNHFQQIMKMSGTGAIESPPSYYFRPEREPSALAFDTQGRLLVAGSSVRRLHADGTTDTAFDTNADSVIRAITVTDDGWIYIGGDFMTVWGSRLPRLARVYPEDRRQPYILGPYLQGDDVEIAFDTHDGWTYTVETVADLSGEWMVASRFQGTGKRTILKDPLRDSDHRFYRVRADR